MKICFYEYRHYNIACGDNNFVEAWHSLLNDTNEIEYVQYSEEFVKPACYQHTVQHISATDMSKYDLIIINNLYHSRIACRKEGKLQEFIDNVYQLPAKTLYVNHERYCIHPFLHGPNTYALASVCDNVLTYLPHLYRYILKSDKAVKLDFEHFYKPIEGTPVEVERDIDLLYLARFSRQKGTYRYPEFAKEYFTKLYQTTGKIGSIEMNGFVPSISNVEIRKSPMMINCLGSTSSMNSGQSFIRLYNEIHDRQTVVDKFSRAKYSWNCFDVSRKYNDPTKILEFGLEACPLESIIYGCVPILRNIQKNIQIRVSADKVMKLEDFNCAIFMDYDDTSRNEAIERMMSEEEWTKMHQNCLTFSKLITNKQYFLFYVTKLLNSFKTTPTLREHTTTNSIKEKYSLKDLVNNVKGLYDESL